MDAIQVCAYMPYRETIAGLSPLGLTGINPFCSRRYIVYKQLDFKGDKFIDNYPL